MNTFTKSSRTIPGLFVCALFLAGCSKEMMEHSAASAPVLASQYRVGSLTVIVSVSETNITSAGSIRLQIDLHTPVGEEIQAPDITPAISPFSVSSSYMEPVQLLSNGKRLHQYVWVVVPGRPGATVFRPIAIKTGFASLQTEPIPVTVTSLLPAEEFDLEIRDIAGPVELLPEQRTNRALIYLTAVGLIALAVIFPALRYAGRKPQDTALQPCEIACQALDRLPVEDVPRIHALNRILRTYVETRFGRPSLGRTTQQIAALATPAGGNFTPALEKEYIAFLESCEQVRFSNKLPNGFVQEAEETVRRLIDSTMEVPECV